MTTSGLDDYFNEIGRIPVLTKEAQLRHTQRIYKWVNWPEGRDKAPPKVSRSGRHSMDVMVSSNLRLVVSVARKYTGRGIDLNDLIQEGTLGLIRGLELYDPTRGYAMSTYAYWWIRQAMTRALYTYAREIRLPINAYELLNKARRVSAEHMSLTGETLSTPELAARMGIPLERLHRVLETAGTTECVSLDAPLDPTKDTALIDLALTTPTPESDGITDLSTFVAVFSNPYLAHKALKRVSKEDQYLLQALYFEDRTTRELGDELDLTPAQVRQRVGRAIRTLRPYLRR